MPQRAPHPCAKAGCGELAVGRYCPEHAYLKAELERERKARFDDERGPTKIAGRNAYSRRWRKYRLRFLKEHPLCEMCDSRGVTRAATEVDHRIPHKGDEELFWNPSNHQALCKSHHSSKTAREDSGFARRGARRIAGEGG